MGDRTYFQGRIVECDPLKFDAIVELLEVGPEVTSPTPLLEIGEAWGQEERNCGVVNETAVRLAELDPTAAWIMWEDPKYEWLGEVAVHLPGLPLYMMECNSDGTPQIVYEQVKATGIFEADEWDAVHESLKKMRELFGVRQFQNLRELEAKYRPLTPKDPAPKITHAITVHVGVDPLEGKVGARAYCTGCRWLSAWVWSFEHDSDAEVTIAGVDLDEHLEILAGQLGQQHLADAG